MKREPILLLAPGVLALAAAFCFPIGQVLWLALHDSAGQFTAGNFSRFFVDAYYPWVAERTIRLSLPTLPDLGVGMTSDNDGPVDRAASNPTAQTIVVVDRVALALKPVDPGTVAPGEAGATLLALVATNTYSNDKTLTGLTISNSGSGPGTQAERDGELQVLTLREDKDEDQKVSQDDPVLATAVFVDGYTTKPARDSVHQDG